MKNDNTPKSVDELLLQEMAREDIVETAIESGYGTFIDVLTESENSKRSIFDN